VDPQGRVRFSYPAGYMTTRRGWRIKPMRTSEFTCGADQLFAEDEWGSEALRGCMAWPDKPEDCNEVFERTGTMFQQAFEFARGLGVKTCVGTELPLSIPKRVCERLKARGKDPADPAVVREVYQGVFQRIMKACPVDYYWIWTSEAWTAYGASDAEIEAAQRELLLAWEAAQAVRAPFTLATCGWVLGPPKDRAQFDRVLPKDMPFSCINRAVGREPVEPQFAKIEHRPKWAIPWLEDDPNLLGVVDELAALRSEVQGAGNLERFDYWLNSFGYLRAMARLGCTLGQLDSTMAALGKEADPAKKKQLALTRASPQRQQIPAQWQEMMTCLLAAVGSSGELGTISDLEQVARPGVGLERHDSAL
jgi:hypothetical protein